MLNEPIKDLIELQQLLLCIIPSFISHTNQKIGIHLRLYTTFLFMIIFMDIIIALWFTLGLYKSCDIILSCSSVMSPLALAHPDSVRLPTQVLARLEVNVTPGSRP